MRTLIAYATSHGTARNCAEHLLELLDGDTTLVQLGVQKVPPLDDFDQIIVGGSIHIGRIQKPVRKFLVDRYDELVTKRLGLFICCLAEDKEADDELATAFPEPLRERAIITSAFGGCFLPARVNFIQRKAMEMIIRRMPDNEDYSPGDDVDHLDMEAIKVFAERMNQQP